MVWRHSSDISTCARVCLICWEAVVLAGWRAAKREAQMAACSEHEFEGRVSGELSGEIFGWRHVHSLENPNDVTSSPKKQKSTWPRLGSDLKGIIHVVQFRCAPREVKNRHFAFLFLLFSSGLIFWRSFTCKSDPFSSATCSVLMASR